MLLHALILGSLESLSLCPMRKLRDSTFLPPVLKAPYLAWQEALRIFGIKPFLISPHTPLWGNSHLPHFRNLLDFIYWPNLQIKCLRDLLDQGTLLTLPKLQERYPNRPIDPFRYMQLQHAFRGQFGGCNPIYHKFAVTNVLHSPDSQKLVSVLYKSLLEAKPSPFQLAFAKWQLILPSITDDMWEEATDRMYYYLISTRDRLISFKILHLYYYSPKRLNRIFPNKSPLCPRCSCPSADFLHVLWVCPKVQNFWSRVVQCLSDYLDLPQVISPEACILGVVDDLVPQKYTRILYRTLLFYARKAIIQHWLQPVPPSFDHWVNLVNRMLPMIKITYEARGMPDKFVKIWEKWLDAFPLQHDG
ncbi:uncharacterized protein LOC121402175 [Xenopus laevis]|uniref:Uncharacterized protein LOC121402175 n=1 Tax=Xenopus laevis TaxID=8355 RepID=A0A8J1MTP1_XENLA|nr:uncharacterized protein LOC121402175 [Xenopus laevis]